MKIDLRCGNCDRKLAAASEPYVEPFAGGAALFYLDPPYWQTAGYGPEFGWDQFQLMAKLLRKIQGKAIISLNDHPDIRACFEGYHFESTDIRYTVGSGKGAEAKEVLIFNWNIEEEPAGLF